MHNRFCVPAIFTQAMYDFSPALVFTSQSRYTIKISTVPISSERKYSMDIKFSGSDAGGFQFDPNAAPKPKRERKPRKSIGSSA